MVLELHVWGPAFGLPSIDADCLAAIAYLRICLPSGDWRLVPDTDLICNPLGELPALKDGATWVAGYNNIIDYLRSRNSAWDLDEELNAADAADCVAYTSFLRSRGLPLLNLSLYVSSENYSACTRPAYGSILSWPDSWFVPHQIREHAKNSSEHLGLSGLDVDSAQDEDTERGLSAQIPKSLRKQRQSVSALLGYKTRKSKFRLDAVTSDFLEPVDKQLGQGQWLITDAPTSADCLAVGIVALMQISAELPQPWLRTALKTKSPRLNEWARIRGHEWFGKSVTMSQLAKDGGQNHDLPWQLLEPMGLQRKLNSVILNVTAAMPLLRCYLDPTETYSQQIIQTDRTASRHKERQRAIVQVRDRQLWYSQALASSVTTAILATVLAWNGLLKLPDLHRSKPSSRTFGEAGALLGLG